MSTPEESESTSAVELPPLGTEEEFAAEVAALVGEHAPEVFALVEEEGDRVDAWIFGWGFAFDERVDVITSMGTIHTGFRSVEEARRRFAMRGKIRIVRLDVSHSATTHAPSRPLQVRTSP